MTQAVIGLAGALILLAFSTLVAVIVYQNQKASERRDAEFDRLKTSVVYEDTCHQCRVHSDGMLNNLTQGQREISDSLKNLTSEVAVLNDRVKG